MLRGTTAVHAEGGTTIRETNDSTTFVRPGRFVCCETISLYLCVRSGMFCELRVFITDKFL